MKVSFFIDGMSISADEGMMLIEAAKSAGIIIPTLCYHEALKPYGACRLCLVEVLKDRRRRVVTSCNYPCEAGIEVFTDTEKIRKYRKVAIELLLRRCPDSEVIRKKAEEMGIDEASSFPWKGDSHCILCGLCVRVCDEIVGASAITLSNRGVEREVTTPFNDISIECIGCGGCSYICPTGCIEMVRKGKGRMIRMTGHSLPPCCGDYRCDECEVDKDFMEELKVAISSFRLETRKKQ